MIKRLFIEILVVALMIAGTAAAGRLDVENARSVKPANYAFMFIGDGMELQQISAAEIYLGATMNNARNDKPGIEKFTFSRLINRV
jgi:alkaline phosphatase